MKYKFPRKPPRPEKLSLNQYKAKNGIFSYFSKTFDFNKIKCCEFDNNFHVKMKLS